MEITLRVAFTRHDQFKAKSLSFESYMMLSPFVA